MEAVAAWHAANGAPTWLEQRDRALRLLAEATRLESMAELVGAASLPDRERLVLLTARMLREAVLQQSSLSQNDSYSATDKQEALLEVVIDSHDACSAAILRGVRVRGHRTRRPIAARPGGGRDPARRRSGCPCRRRTDLRDAAGAGMTGRAPVEYTDVSSVRGPLIAVQGIEGVGWDEVVSIRLPSGATRRGVVLEVSRDLAIVEVYEGTSGLSPTALRVEFEGSPMQIAVGPQWLGRVCSGSGEPLDAGPPVFTPQRSPVAGYPINPAARATPRDPITTGLSIIDGLATLVRGQKLPIFSVGGLPHLELATQIAAQASAGGEPFAVIFAAMGITHADATMVREGLEERASSGDLALFLNTADDPIVERVLTPRIALTDR